MQGAKGSLLIGLTGGALLLAACGTDDGTESPEPTAPVTDDLEAPADDDVSGADEGTGDDPTAQEDGSDVPMASLAEAGLDPDDGWDDRHWDVEVPEDPGTAVLVLDGQRHTLNGICTRSGPIDTDAEQRDQMGYFSVGAMFDADAADFGVEVTRSYGVPGLGGPPHFLHFDQVKIGVGPAGGTYDHWSYLDGSPWLDRSVDSVTEATEPFVRVDPSGVLTAVGEIQQSALGTDLEGAFELGIRCDTPWGDSSS